MRTIATLFVLLSLSSVALAQENDDTATDATETNVEAAETADAPDDAPAAVVDRGDPLVFDAGPSLSSATGLAHMYTAHGLPVGEFGLSLWTEYFSGTDVVRTGDNARRFIGHLGLSWTPIDHLEAFVELSARATTNTLGDPELIQSVGDTSFGAKGFGEPYPGLHFGGLLRLNLPAGANSVGLDPSALNLDILALATVDLRELADVPVRIHVNGGYLLDNSAQLFPFVLERTERFGHNVYDYDRIHLALGVDAPVQYITPFIEYQLDIPTGAPCDSTNPQPCVTDNGLSAYPSWITLGARSAPLGEGLAFSGAFDIGVTTAESQGTPAVSGWNFILGLSYNLNPMGRTEYIEVPVEVPTEAIAPAATGYVIGTIANASTGEPVDGARIAYVGTEYTDQITSEDGRFRSVEFPPGEEVTIEVSHPDFVMRSLRVTISEEPREGTIELTEAFDGARVSGTITSMNGTPIGGALAFRGAGTADVDLDSGESDYSVDLEPGEYTVTAYADGYVSQREQITFESGRVTRDWRLELADAGTLWRMTGDVIAPTGDASAITFDDGELTDGARAALDALAAQLAASPETSVRVRAHTDAGDDAAAEIETTTARADAVVAYLIEAGVAAERLTAEGVGGSEPLFPNISDRNRQRNNRVEFVLE